MIKVKWEVEELVALVDIYRNSEGKTTEQIERELMCLSDLLEKRADKLGIRYDGKFRNLNGMKMMFQNVRYIATKGERGMSSTGYAMQKVYEMLEKSPEVFELILAEFFSRYATQEG